MAHSSLCPWLAQCLCSWLTPSLCPWLTQCLCPWLTPSLCPCLTQCVCSWITPSLSVRGSYHVYFVTAFSSLSCPRLTLSLSLTPSLSVACPISLFTTLPSLSVHSSPRFFSVRSLSLLSARVSPHFSRLAPPHCARLTPSLFVTDPIAVYTRFTPSLFVTNPIAVYTRLTPSLSVHDSPHVSRSTSVRQSPYLCLDSPHLSVHADPTSPQHLQPRFLLILAPLLRRL